MAGTATITEQTHEVDQCIEFAWASDGTGTSAATTTKKISGVLTGAVFVPDGTDPPDDNYDVTVKDENEADVLGGQGSNLSGSSTEQFYTGLGAVCQSQLTLAVAQAGASNAGKVILYLR